MRLPLGVQQAIAYLENTYQTKVEVWESMTRAWRFYLYLPQLPNQEFSQQDIIVLSNLNCYRSEGEDSHHFYTAL